MSAATERLISADDHVDIGHDRIKAHLSTKFHDDYDTALGKFRASIGQAGSTSNNTSLVAARSNPRGLAGHSDAKQRLADMDADGVSASSTYCEVSAYRYLYMLEDGPAEATRAFNVALAEWASADPHRLLVSFQIPIHDIDAAVREVQTVRAEGGRSLQLPVYPRELDLPDYWDERYDPLWAAVTDADLPVCFHIGQNSLFAPLAQRDPTPNRAITIPLVAMSTGEAFGMFVLTGLLERFPQLKTVFVEPGIGWAAWWLYMVDDMYTRQGYTFTGLKDRPSAYFHRNVHLTFIDEPNVLQHAEILGVENILWSSDYPHPVSTWPNSRKLVDEMFEHVPARERALITCGNAERVWNID